MSSNRNEILMAWIDQGDTVPQSAKQGVESLTREIMTLQATGDYARGKALMERLVVIRPQVKALLARTTDLPVDIEPHFATEL